MSILRYQNADANERAYALATGFSLEDSYSAAEKVSRRRRYERRHSQVSRTQGEGSAN